MPASTVLQREEEIELRSRSRLGTTEHLVIMDDDGVASVQLNSPLHRLARVVPHATVRVSDGCTVPGAGLLWVTLQRHNQRLHCFFKLPQPNLGDAEGVPCVATVRIPL